MVSYNTPIGYRKHSNSCMPDPCQQIAPAETVRAKTGRAPAPETRTSIAARHRQIERSRKETRMAVSYRGNSTSRARTSLSATWSVIAAHEENVRQAVSKMVIQAKENCLADDDCTRINAVVNNYLHIPRVSFFAGPPAKVGPLRNQLGNDARPLRVPLYKYSYKQREFSHNMVSRLLCCGMIPPSPSSARACPPLLAPKPGPTCYCISVTLPPFSKYAIRLHFPMPSIEQERTFIFGFRSFAQFDRSHGYWQFVSDPDSL